MMDPVLDHLHDIEGLDAISFWPFSPAFWVLLLFGTFVLVGVAGGILFKIAQMRSWKYDALQKLKILQSDLSEPSARQTIILLSEYMRRIALKRFSREQCASLIGKAWLRWLSENDPKKFDWENKGIALIEVPYAPVNPDLRLDKIQELIQAAKEWVR